MFAVRQSALRAVAVGCCAALGLVWTPGVAGAAPAVGSGGPWAVVNNHGKLVRGNGAIRASRLSKGRFAVDFGTKLNQCAYEATAGDTADGEVPGPAQVTVGQQSGRAKRLFIQTFAQGTTSKLADLPFHVTAYCGANASFAVVKDDGTLARGSHVTSALRASAGLYKVFFDHDVHACAFSATVGTAVPGEVVVPNDITVAGVLGDNSGVLVKTPSITAGALPVDTPFHLAVNCDPAALIAVVNADGTTARGTNVVSSSKLETSAAGLYEVIFNRNVTRCAYTATIGEPFNAGSIDAPVAITTASREKNADGVFIQITDTTIRLTDEPFHLTVTC